jgi:mannose/fructose/N-acetylgalactosamine-specific phosphotransferase system component IIC
MIVIVVGGQLVSIIGICVILGVIAIPLVMISVLGVADAVRYQKKKKEEKSVKKEPQKGQNEENK